MKVSNEDFAALIADAKQGLIPADSEKWEIYNEDGLTLAHFAAKYGYLPKGFNKWNLKSEDGRLAVGVTACVTDHLPENFDWSMIDEVSGMPYSHVLIVSKMLPSNFDGWDAKDYDGTTAAELFLSIIPNKLKFFESIYFQFF